MVLFVVNVVNISDLERVLPPATPEEAAARAGEGYNTVDWYFSTRSL